MNTAYKPVDTEFYESIKKLHKKRKYIGILYFTPLRELIAITAIIKDLYTTADTPFIVLTTGEEIRLDWVVKAGNAANPDYDFEDFTCDC